MGVVDWLLTVLTVVALMLAVMNWVEIQRDTRRKRVERMNRLRAFAREEGGSDVA